MAPLFIGRASHNKEKDRMKKLENKLQVRSELVHLEQINIEHCSPTRTIPITIYRFISVTVYQLRTNFRQFFMTAPNKFQDFKSPFSLRKKEQAEAGRSPALLAVRYRYGGFAYPPGILEAVFTHKLKEKRILGSIPYNWIIVRYFG
jgi:hypothetical protein